MATLAILDAPSIFYRAHRTARPQFTSTDFPVGAIFGFARTLIQVQARPEPEYLVAVTEDETLTAERIRELPGAGNDNLLRQIPNIPKFLRAFSIPVLQIPGQRSADLAATLTQLAVKERFTVRLMACGHDFFQLVGKGVSVENPFARKQSSSQTIIARFGVPPSRIPDYLALTGSERSGPGVPGIGPKNARVLLDRFGSIENLLEQTEDIAKPSLREMMRENADLLRVSSRLALFDPTLPLTADLRDFERKPVAWQDVIELLREFELTGLARKIPLFRNLPISRIARTPSDVRAFVETVDRDVTLATRVESSPSQGGFLSGLALATSADRCLYIPIHTPENSGKALMEEARPLLEDPRIRKTGHDLRADTLALRREGVGLRGQGFDTLLADALLTPKRHGHSVEQVALAHLSRTGWRPDASPTATRGAEAPLDQVAEQACEDVSLIAELVPVLESKLKGSGLYRLFEGLDVPLVALLADMDYRGLRVDFSLLTDRILPEMEEDLLRLRRRAWFLGGDEFDLSSASEVREILFTRLRLPPPRRTPDGYSVDDAVLEELSENHELPPEILDHRYLTRLKHWCLSLLDRQAEGVASIARPGAHPGSPRFDPLAPLPVFSLDTWKTRVRKVFVARQGFRFVCGTFDELRVRILGHLSREENLTRTLLHPSGNVPRDRAAHLFDADPQTVSSEMLRRGGSVQQAVVHGIGFADLARHLGMPVAEGRLMLDQYFRRYPGVLSWAKEAADKARREGLVTTLFGRQVPLPPEDSQGWREWVMSSAHRIAAAAIGATASDMIQTAVHRIGENLARKNLKSHLLGFSLEGDVLAEAVPEEVEAVRDIIREEMEGVLKLSVPVTASVGTGRSWEEARSA